MAAGEVAKDLKDGRTAIDRELARQLKSAGNLVSGLGRHDLANELWLLAHEREQMAKGRYWRHCGECGATWWTETTWRRAVSNLAEEMWRSGRKDWVCDFDQPMCPECSHDF